jgi:hypothetical protein
MMSKHNFRIYDNGGSSLDRYTIFPPEASPYYHRHKDGRIEVIASSEDPYHPQGFGQWTSAMPGKHLGKRISWEDLPEPVKRHARQSFPDCFERMAVYAEYTDTFGGEANYCWVRRARLLVPTWMEDSEVMRLVKAELGLTGLRGRKESYGDSIKFRPYGMCTVLFVHFMYDEADFRQEVPYES